MSQTGTIFRCALLLGSMALWVACNDTPKNEDTTNNTTTTAPAVTAPVFDAQAAFAHVQKQVDFGPRVPGSTAWKQCGNWLVEAFKAVSDTVYVQETTVTQPGSNKTYPCKNIIAAINPNATDRILILAHWDSRPWADEDVNNTDKPIDAADDGASGVAVMLEMARCIKTQNPNKGIDFLLVDTEDVGKSEWGEKSYCLGSQYWGMNPHVPNYKARWGACLDMVGAKGAQFPLEGYSNYYAPDIQKKIWDTGNRLGFSDYFRYIQGGQITDDHVVVNETRGIPTVDIINLQPGGGFGKHWHTHNDNVSIIDPATMKAVGQTLLQVIYEN